MIIDLVPLMKEKHNMACCTSIRGHLYGALVCPTVSLNLKKKKKKEKGSI